MTPAVTDPQGYIDDFLKQNGYDPQSGARTTAPKPEPPPEEEDPAIAQGLVDSFLGQNGFDPITGRPLPVTQDANALLAQQGLATTPPGVPLPPGLTVPLRSPLIGNLPGVQPGLPAQLPRPLQPIAAYMGPEPPPLTPPAPPRPPASAFVPSAPQALRVDPNASARWQNPPPLAPPSPTIQVDPEVMARWRGPVPPTAPGGLVEPKDDVLPRFQPQGPGWRDIEIGLQQGVQGAALPMARIAEQIYGRVPLASGQSLAEAMQASGASPQEIEARSSLESMVLQGLSRSFPDIIGYVTTPGGGIASMALRDALVAGSEAESPEDALHRMIPAAAKGAAMGEAMEAVGPYSRAVRMPAMGALGYGTAKLEGEDDRKAIASGITLAGLSGMHGGEPEKALVDVERHNAMADALLERERRAGMQNLTRTERAQLTREPKVPEEQPLPQGYDRDAAGNVWDPDGNLVTGPLPGEQQPPRMTREQRRATVQVPDETPTYNEEAERARDARERKAQELYQKPLQELTRDELRHVDYNILFPQRERPERMPGEPLPPEPEPPPQPEAVAPPEPPEGGAPPEEGGGEPPEGPPPPPPPPPEVEPPPPEPRAAHPAARPAVSMPADEQARRRELKQERSELQRALSKGNYRTLSEKDFPTSYSWLRRMDEAGRSREGAVKDIKARIAAIDAELRKPAAPMARRPEPVVEPETEQQVEAQAEPAARDWDKELKDAEREYYRYLNNQKWDKDVQALSDAERREKTRHYDDLRHQIMNEAPSWRERGSYGRYFEEQFIDPLRKLTERGNLDKALREGTGWARDINGWMDTASIWGIEPETAYKDMVEAGLPRKHADAMLKKAAAWAEKNIGESHVRPEFREKYQRTIDFARETLGEPEPPKKGPTGPRKPKLDPVIDERVDHVLADTEKLVREGGSQFASPTEARLDLTSSIGSINKILELIPEDDPRRQRLIDAQEGVRRLLTGEKEAPPEGEAGEPGKWKEKQQAIWTDARGNHHPVRIEFVHDKKGRKISVRKLEGDKGLYAASPDSLSPDLETAKAKREGATRRGQLVKGRPGWTRLSPEGAGTIAGHFRYEPNGAEVEHAHHPTANYPYQLRDGEGNFVPAPNGRAFQKLQDAMDAAEKLPKPEGRAEKEETPFPAIKDADPALIAAYAGLEHTDTGVTYGEVIKRGLARGSSKRYKQITPGEVSAQIEENLREGRIPPEDIERAREALKAESEKAGTPPSEADARRAYQELQDAEQEQWTTAGPARAKATKRLTAAKRAVETMQIEPELKAELEKEAEAARKARIKGTIERVDKEIDEEEAAGRDQGRPSRSDLETLARLADANRKQQIEINQQLRDLEAEEAKLSGRISDAVVKAERKRGRLGDGRDYARIAPKDRLRRTEVQREIDALKQKQQALRREGERLWQGHDVERYDYETHISKGEELPPERAALYGEEAAPPERKPAGPPPERLKLDFSEGNEQAALEEARAALKRVTKHLTDEQYKAAVDSLDSLNAFVEDGREYYKWDAADESAETGKPVTAGEVWDRHVAKEVAEFRKAIGEEALAKPAEVEIREVEPAEPPVKGPTGPSKGKKPTAKQKAAARDAFRKDVFTPGNVITSYAGHDKVLKYEDDGKGTWRVQVQAVDKEGNPLPNERPRWHQTEPDPKRTEIISRPEPVEIEGTDFEKSFRPVSEKKPPTVRQAFSGNNASEGKLVTDGMMLIDTSVVSDGRKVSTLKKPTNKATTREIEQKNLSKIFDGFAKEAVTPAEEIGYANAPSGLRQGDMDIAFYKVGDKTLAYDASKVRAIQDLTGADEARGGVKNGALVFYKDGKPVAALAQIPRVGVEFNPEIARMAAKQPAKRGVLEKLDEAGKKADQRLRDKGVIGGEKQYFNPVFDPETWRDMTISLAGDVARGVMNFDQFKDHMLKLFGKKIRSYLPDLWQNATDMERLMKWPLTIRRGGKKGEVLASDVGLALERQTSRHLGRLERDSDPELRKARALERAAVDLRYLMHQENSGQKWYTEAVAELDDVLRKHKAEFQDPDNLALFKYVLGITSNSLNPLENLKLALKIWDMRKDTGQFHAYYPGTQTEAKPAGDPIGLRSKSFNTALSNLNRLIQDKGGIPQTVEWLKTEHPVREISPYGPKDGVPGGADAMRLGSYAFGEKVGAFGANLNGIHDQLTADVWWSRTWNRWMGTMMDTDRHGNQRFDEFGNPMLQDAPRNEGERNLMREVAAEVAGKLGLQVDELQALLWYAEQRLYTRHGADSRSIDFADAAKQIFEARDVRPEEDAGDRGPPEAGGEDALAREAERGPARIPQELPGKGARAAQPRAGYPARRSRRQAERGASPLEFISGGLLGREKKPARKGPVPYREQGPFQQLLGDLKAALLPETLGPKAEATAHRWRQGMGESKHRERMAEVALNQARRHFRGKYLVPEEFRQAIERAKTEDRDLTPEEMDKMGDGLKFLDRMEKGEAQPSAKLQALSDTMRDILDTHRRVVNQKTGKLEQFNENYFPHEWDRPDEARQMFLDMQRRGFAGPKKFLKPRTVDTIVEGVKRGLKPKYDNPVDGIMAKIREMNQFVNSSEMLEWQKKHMKGMAKYVPENQGVQPPRDWKSIQDPAFIHYGKPSIKVREFTDALLTGRLNTFAKALGIPHEREATPFKEHPNAAGLAYPSGKVKTQFASHESTLAHEIGHQLEWKFNLSKKLRERKIPGLAKELRDLADLRAEGFDPGPSHKKYLHSVDEKMANAAAMLVYMPERFKQVAPQLWDAYRDELYHAENPDKSSPVKHPLRPFVTDMEKSMVLGTNYMDMPVKGSIIKGRWYMPPEVARIHENRLKMSKLAQSKLYRGWMHGANALNQLQLLGAFHAGATAHGAIESKTAAALERLAAGDVKGAAKSGAMAASIVGAPLQYWSRGGQLKKAYETGDPKAWQKSGLAQYLPQKTKDWLQMDPRQMARTIYGMEQGGHAVQMKGSYSNNMVEKFMDALGKQEYGKAVLRALPAGLERLMKPVMENMVPRMKAGALADILHIENARIDKLNNNWERISEEHVNEDGTYDLEGIASDPQLDRKGKNEIRRLIERVGEKKAAAYHEPFRVQPEMYRKAMAEAQNSVDNRMGQLEYDNTFMNQTVKALLHGAIRSVGWNWGTLMEHGGGALDAAKFTKRLKEGDPVMTHRMAYLLATPLVNGLMSAMMTQIMTRNHPDPDKRGILDPKKTGLSAVRWKDLAFPRSGNTDEYGRDERYQQPTYFKDWMHLGYGLYDRDPGGLAKILTNKANPAISAASELLQNRGYFGEQLYDTRGPLDQRAISLLKAIGKEAMPFSYRGYQKAVERGGDTRSKVLPFFGFTPAPAYANKSSFERYMDKHSQGYLSAETKTEEQYAHGRALRELTRDLRSGDMQKAQDTLIRHVKAGDLIFEDAKKAWARAQKDPYQASFDQLRDYPVVIEAMKRASAEERKKLQATFLKRMDALDKQSPNIREDALQQIKDAGLLYLFAPQPVQ